jgi:hypothetical protein
MKKTVKQRQTVRPTPPMRPDVGQVTNVTHRFVQHTGGHRTHAGEPGAGDIEYVPSRSRAPSDEDLGIFETAKVDKEEGSIGGDVIAGGVAYDSARLQLRSRGIWMEPRVGNETPEQLISKLLIALKDKRRAGSKKRAEIDELRKVDAEVRQRSGAADLGLGVPPGPGEISPRRARQAAAEALDSLNYTPDPVPRRRRRMALSDGTILTRARARAAAEEQLRNAGLI